MVRYSSMVSIFLVVVEGVVDPARGWPLAQTVWATKGVVFGPSACRAPACGNNFAEDSEKKEDQ